MIVENSTTGMNTRPSVDKSQPVSGARLCAGYVASGLAALFFVVDGGMKLFKPPVVVEATTQLGYPEETIVGIGIALLVATLLYVISRTSVLGAILLTGYLGGAVASHVRIAAWSNVALPIVFAALVWGGLWLRDRRIEKLIPLTASQ